MTIERSLKLAQQNGYLDGKFQTYSDCFLDPAFWQTLGKAPGWLDLREEGGTEGWLYYWHSFIDHLAAGKDADSFFKGLTPPN